VAENIDGNLYKWKIQIVDAIDTKILRLLLLFICLLWNKWYYWVRNVMNVFLEYMSGYLIGINVIMGCIRNLDDEADKATIIKCCLVIFKLERPEKNFCLLCSIFWALFPYRWAKRTKIGGGGQPSLFLEKSILFGGHEFFFVPKKVMMWPKNHLGYAPGSHQSLDFSPSDIKPTYRIRVDSKCLPFMYRLRVTPENNEKHEIPLKMP